MTVEFDLGTERRSSGRHVLFHCNNITTSPTSLRGIKVLWKSSTLYGLMTFGAVRTHLVSDYIFVYTIIALLSIILRYAIRLGECNLFWWLWLTNYDWSWKSGTRSLSMPTKAWRRPDWSPSRFYFGMWTNLLCFWDKPRVEEWRKNKLIACRRF